MLYSAVDAAVGTDRDVVQHRAIQLLPLSNLENSVRAMGCAGARHRDTCCYSRWRVGGRGGRGEFSYLAMFIGARRPW